MAVARARVARMPSKRSVPSVSVNAMASAATSARNPASSKMG